MHDQIYRWGNVCYYSEMKKQKLGEMIIPAGSNIWPHELLTANALVSGGYVVEFLGISNRQHLKSPDILLDGRPWEIKSPKADKLSAIERNLKRASKQCGNIIIDSYRMSKVHDASIQKLLMQKYKQQKSIKRLLFINRKREVIDICQCV